MGQRVGSVMPNNIFLLRERVCFYTTQRGGEARVFDLNMFWKMHWSLKTHGGTRREIKV